jgi:uncharacterized phage-associated protein
MIDESMRLKELLPAIIRQHESQTGLPPAKTKLLKLAYLVDLEHTRLTGSRLLEEDWYFHRFGPFVFSYYDDLESPDFDVQSDRSSAGFDFDSVRLSEEAGEPALSFDAQRALNHVMGTHGRDDLNTLLDHVYFDTEPMLDNHGRGEKLDFLTVRPASEYRVRELKFDRKKERQILRRLRDKARKLNG